MPIVGRRKRPRRKAPIELDRTVEIQGRHEDVGGRASGFVANIEEASSLEEQDQEAVNQQIAMEQKLRHIETRVKSTISSEALDVGVAKTDLGVNKTCSTESPNASTSPIAMLKAFNSIGPPIVQKAYSKSFY
ncbi:hypothetical protein E8E12_000401 [Didymella heteroderae]|uniref:Uncharacterized protein n=1 Tax=Didymella heteroderae TaxID=1769908 RepID=A0A9P5BU45_9PLEO|nr:hypothetical protein E8E12_000401 [Didymella heteroderae]